MEDIDPEVGLKFSKKSRRKKRICTRCGSHFENPTNFKILKEPLLVQKQNLHQQTALDLSFNLTP